MNPEFEQAYKEFHERYVWFDRSETGKIAVLGADRFSWLQGMVSNDIHLLMNTPRGEIQACLLDATGHIESDLHLIKVLGIHDEILSDAVGSNGQDFLLIDLPRGNVEKVMTLLDRYIIMEDVELRDVSNKVGCISLQGKRAKETWDNGFSDRICQDTLQFKVSEYAQHSIYIGFDVYFSLEENARVEHQQRLKQCGISEINVEMQELLRVEAGIPKWGAELDKSVIASEAVGAAHISLTKGCYIGQEIIARIDARGHTNRALTGFVVQSENVPQAGDKLFAMENGSERETGRITSVVPFSPAAGGKPIALGFARHEHRSVGNELMARGANGETRVFVAELPFDRRAAA